ncbi:MAG: EamA family transporter RarD [Chloroflexi bacterium]|nr:EamA family transporter RarD [Chloroflexota bacterium]
MNRGILYAAFAYICWGLLPIYWKAFQDIGASEIVAHRIIWSLVFVVILLVLRRRWKWFRQLKGDRKTWILLISAAALLALNWFTYIWGVNHGYIVEASLGYFMVPLASVLLGVLVLHEHLRPWQWVAVALAAVGVLYLTLGYGNLPWIALSLAFTFSVYGLIKKQVKLDALEGLSAEMAILTLPALAYMAWLNANGQMAFGQVGLQQSLLLIGAGAITAIPLLSFAAGARRIPLTTLGLLQYIAPTLQFLLGVFVYGESFSVSRWLGYCIIWMALIIYTADSANYRRRRARTALSATPSSLPG